MSRTTRTGVLGLYRSGSTAVAGVLQHLGVDMGAPFWGHYYESRFLSEQLRLWWNEPFLEQQVDKEDRVRALGRWINSREALGNHWVGCKHPLLVLCGEDLIEAWGPETRFIWSYRALDESIESIVRLNWWPEQGERLQRILWEEVHKFFCNTEYLRVELAEMLDDPRRQVERIVEYVRLQPTAGQIEAAVAFIRPRDSSQG